MENADDIKGVEEKKRGEKSALSALLHRGSCLFKALGIFLFRAIEFEREEGKIPQF